MTTTRSTRVAAEIDVAPPSLPPEHGGAGEIVQSPRFMGAGLVAVGVLLLGLLTTVLVAVLISGQVDRENAVRQARAQEALEQDLEARITIYSETLIGLQGLFASSEEVTRDDFVRFTEVTRTFERFPGLQGLSFSPVVLRTDLEDYENFVRADGSVNGVGYPDFVVRTEGDLTDLFVVDFIVPFEGNEAAFGFDLGSNPARRTAIEEARDTGQVVATAPITLVQEQGEQAGVLLLAPAYDGPSGTTAERRSSFVGVFSAVLRMGDFLDGASSQRDLGFAVFDESADQRETTNGRAEMYATGDGAYLDSPASFVVEVGGRSWGVVLDPATVPTAGHSRALILLGGLAAALPYALASFFSYRERDRLNVQAAALGAAYEEIQSSNADLERFAYVAAHDLRSPIRGVRNVVDILEDELGEGERTPVVDDLLNHLGRSAAKMDAMVHGLLEFATTGAQPTDSWTTVDTRTIALGAVEDAKAANDADLAIKIDVDHLHPVHGNPVLIERLFENLVGNAIKYRDPERELDVKIGSQRTGSMVAISVTDNGIGLAREYHDRIFEIFRRLHGPNEIDGQGIGLALCRKIVEHHEGRIWVASEEGFGATFTFTLPYATTP